MVDCRYFMRLLRTMLRFPDQTMAGHTHFTAAECTGPEMKISQDSLQGNDGLPTLGFHQETCHELLVKSHPESNEWLWPQLFWPFLLKLCGRCVGSHAGR